MQNTRKILFVLTRQPTMEGAGVHLNRLFGHAEAPTFDPFLMLDDFRSDRPEHFLKGFPWHPHRGIETITYVVKGDVDHADSLGNKGIISSGDVQWMTAGSGIIHQEMPKGDTNGSMHGFQLWANLPASQKMMPPRYQDIKADQIPEVVVQNGMRIKVIAGDIEGIRVLVLTGKPLKEPVAWRGPIVMNTQEELETAFQEYQEGRFIKDT